MRKVLMEQQKSLERIHKEMYSLREYLIQWRQMTEMTRLVIPD